ncbi:MAG: hypothetical protein JXB15_03460 [Anaerolineales bacterium]|nr:hypothetical protein [Anaerolineales bacterium]
MLLSGCASLYDPEASQEYRADIVGRVQPGQDLGQTLVVRRPNLSRIYLWLRLENSQYDQQAVLQIELYHSRQDDQPVATASVPYRAIADSFPVQVSISPENNLPNQPYYLVLKSSADPIQVFGRNEEAYPQGQLYIQGSPQSADMGFRLYYDYTLTGLLQDLNPAIRYSWLIFPILLVLWLPGQVLYNLLFPYQGSTQRPPFDWGQRAAIIVALSLAIIPTAMLWSTTLNIHWSRWGAFTASLVLFTTWQWQSRRWIRQLKVKAILDQARSHGHEIALAGIFLLTLGVRLVMVRDLAAPAWVDSVHHAIITRLIAEEGAIPTTYAPYVDSSSANYHPGLHANLAVFSWLSNLPLQTNLLIFCQVLNALSVFAVYLFTRTIFENRSAAVFAALMAGLFTPMPAYYASWGRYTQLAGLLILPAALALIKHIKDTWAVSHRRIIPAILMTGLLAAGLFLTHYRVAVFLACLFLAETLTEMLRAASGMVAPRMRVFAHRIFPSRPEQEAALQNPSSLPGLSRHLLSWLTASLSACLLALPWLQKMLLDPRLVSAGSLQTATAPFADFSWGYLTSALGTYALALAGAGLLLALLLLRWPGVTLILWVGILFLVANLGALRLPGAGFINNTSVEISLFIPISALAGFGISRVSGWLDHLLRAPWRLFFCSIFVLASITAAILGARSITPILNPITMLVRQADLPAMSWIEENIPDHETLAINSFAWGYGLYAGHDGGYWITPLTGRKTMPPSILYALSGSGTVITQTTETSRKILDLSKDPPALYTYLKSEGINYIYIGARGGMFSPSLFHEDTRYKCLYSSQGVYIFKLQP